MSRLSWNSSRRSFLGWTSALAGLASLSYPRVSLFAKTERETTKTLHIYERLGVRTRINAKGTYTFLSGSLMSPEVTRAMEEASCHYVFIPELQEKVGARIAEMLGVESAMVTSGAAGAIMLGTAACLAGKDPERIQRLPDLTGMKSEVIIQNTHRNPFDHAIRNTGVKLVVVETSDELENAFTDKTAMMYFLNAAQHQGKIGLQQWVAAGKLHGVPTFNDAAADVPPPSHLSDYCRMGFDLVAFSGGKGLRGPQCAGLLLGRNDLIEAALLNNNPNEDTIGRPCKVGKEEIVGMLVALERYLKIDHGAEWKEWERRVDAMEEIVSSVPGVSTERFVPDVANHVPHLSVRWDEAALGITAAECCRQLLEGEPCIEVLEDDEGHKMGLTPFMMKPAEDVIVARRIKQILETAHRGRKA